MSFLSAWCTGERRHSRQAGSQQHRSQEQTHHGQADGSPLRLIHVYMPGAYLTGYIPTYYPAECGRPPMVSSLSSNGNGCRERSADPGPASLQMITMEPEPELVRHECFLAFPCIVSYLRYLRYNRLHDATAFFLSHRRIQKYFHELLGYKNLLILISKILSDLDRLHHYT